MKYEKQIGMAQGIVVAILGGLALSMGQRILVMLAGQTVYTSAAFWLSILLGLIVGGGVAYFARRKLGWNATLLVFLCFLFACYLIGLLTVERFMKNGWTHFLLNANRSLTLYLLQIAKTASLYVVMPLVFLSVMFFGRGRSLRASSVNASVQIGLCMIGFSFGGLLLATTGYSVEAMLRMIAVAFAVLSGVNVMRKSKSMSFAWIFSAFFPLIVVAALAITLLPRDWSNPLSVNGIFGRLACRDSGFAQGVPIVTKHTRLHTVTQYGDPDYGWVGALDGRPLIFERRFVASRTMTALAPLMIRPDAKNILMLGEEAGVYLSTLVRIGSVDVFVDPSAGASTSFVKGNDLFTGGEEPARWYRSGTLSELRGKCDVVFVAPPPVWVKGSGQLLSARALQSYRDALGEEGVVAVRVDGRGLSEAGFADLARTFMSVFPGVQVWNTGAADWVLLGGARELKVPLDVLTSLVERKDTFRELVRAGNITLPAALACMVCDGNGLKTWLQERAGKSPESEWNVPVRVIRGENLMSIAFEKVRQPKAPWVLSGQMDLDLYVDILEVINKARDARKLAVQSMAEGMQAKPDASLSAVRASVQASKQDVLILQIVDHMDMEARRRIAIGNYKGALICYENLISFTTGTARYHHGAGYCLRALGEAENAYLAFARAAGGSPEQEQYRLDLAQAALTAGHYEEADNQYQYLLSKKDDDAHVMFLFAKGLALRGRPRRDFALAIKLAERACVLTKWQNREYAYGLADIYIDAGRIPEGMGLKRRLKEGIIELKEK
jgi:MFS family permease